MSYSHYFYAVDLERVQRIYGSRDMNSVATLGKAKPKLKPVLEAIVNGEIDDTIEAAGYGYTLMAICESLGKQIGDDVADVRDHPYESQLACSGPPIPVPYDASNFPQIGFIAASEIKGELKLIDTSSPPSGMRKAPGKRRGPAVQMAAAIADDVASYREALQEAMELGLSIVSFRH